MYVIKKSDTWEGFQDSSPIETGADIEQLVATCLDMSKQDSGIFAVFQEEQNDKITLFSAPSHKDGDKVMLWSSSFISGIGVVPPLVMADADTTIEMHENIYNTITEEVQCALKMVLREGDEDLDDVEIPTGSTVGMLRLLLSLTENQPPVALRLADWAISTTAWLHELGTYTDANSPLRSHQWWSQGLDTSAEIVRQLLDEDRLVPYIEQVRFDAYRIVGKPYRATMSFEKQLPDTDTLLFKAHALVNVHEAPFEVQMSDLPKKVRAYVKDCISGTFIPLLSADVSVDDDDNWSLENWRIAQ